ncbi:MAG: cation-translocating P-type ATPase [Pseudomonadota bacterium]|nr:cation-translocating P-type ATPase [Pseudomonadota bacterium]
MSAATAWANPSLAAQVIRHRRDGCSEVALRVGTLEDRRRLLWLQQRIQALPGVRRVAVDRAAQRVRVIWDPGSTSLPGLIESFEQAGYAATPLQQNHIADTREAEMHDALKRLLVAGMCAMQVMTYAFVIYIGAVDFVDFSTRNLFRWLGLLTSIPLVFYSAFPFYRDAASELRRRTLGINLPVALAVSLVFVASAFNTLRGQGEIYFDSISMFVFVLLAARYLELRSRQHSRALGDAAIDATPMLAARRRADGKLETVAAMTLQPGDLVHVAEGRTVPADGELLSAQARLDEALWSGESRAVERRQGEHVIAGSVLLTGPAEIRVERTAANSAAAHLHDLSARVSRVDKPQSDPAVARFVGRVLLLTGLTALGWLIFDPARAFEATVAVLVVACPCAFALSAPATLARTLGKLAARGVLVTRSDALDRLARADLAMFDKTGTLGIPQLDADSIDPRRGFSRVQVLQWAAALAHESSHPLAQAVTNAARKLGQPVRADRVQVVDGSGIVGEIEGRQLRLGRASFVGGLDAQPNAQSQDDALVLGDSEGVLAVFHLSEQPRPTALHTVDMLQRDGVTVLIASGDAETRVAAMAQRLGVIEWTSRQSPADKLSRLQQARAAGHVTLAVGDGSNDAPLLAAADVSAALSSGTDLAQSNADLILLDGRLDGLLDARFLARQAQSIVAQSRHWALVYNFCAIPFAALGFVPPWLAGIGMSLSSLFVVLNALRAGADGTIEPTSRERPIPA